jgi:hypothetical protein
MHADLYGALHFKRLHSYSLQYCVLLVTKLQAGQSRNCGLIPCSSKRLVSAPKCPCQLGAQNKPLTKRILGAIAQGVKHPGYQLHNMPSWHALGELYFLALLDCFIPRLSFQIVNRDSVQLSEIMLKSIIRWILTIQDSDKKKSDL